MEAIKTDSLRRFSAFLRIGYTELQYWLVGMTPEGYHFQQSRNYDRIGAVKKAVHHAQQALRYGEYSEPRARLGYYSASQGKYQEAADHYRKAISTWGHPSILLALAQMELRIGNPQAAADLVERVEATEMKTQFAAVIAEVRSELQTGNNGFQATREDARA
jgi:hypothetical protein